MASRTKPQPTAGDRRETKTHGTQILVQRMSRDFYGNPIKRIERNGQPVFIWLKPVELDPWDYHHLTAAERAQLHLPAA